MGDITSPTEGIEQLFSAKDYAAVKRALAHIPLHLKTPLHLSAEAVCQAEIDGEFKKSVTLCHEAIKRDSKNPEHYYRQAHVLHLAGRKKDAIWVLRMGLRHGRHKGILDALGSYGIRKTPLLPFLPRSNALNKYLGLLLSRINVR